MKEQIQQLIAGAQTKDALNLLVQKYPDALLLQAQYNNGEKQFNLGLIEFSEWGRIQAKVNNAALAMVGGNNASSGNTPTSPQNTKAKTLLDFNALFQQIEHNKAAYNFSESLFRSWVNELNILCNTKAFSPLLDGLNPSLVMERTNKLLTYCNAMRPKLEKEASEEAEASKKDALKYEVQNFINAPTIAGWHKLYPQLSADIFDNGWGETVQKCVDDAVGEDFLFIAALEDLPFFKQLNTIYK